MGTTSCSSSDFCITLNFNRLFEELAMDISSDISVMKSMMAQDGLTAEGQGVAAQMQMKQ